MNMRRFLRPSSIVPTVIIATVFAMVAYANWREGKRSRVPYTSAPPIGVPGAPTTSRENLEQRIHDMEARLVRRLGEIRDSDRIARIDLVLVERDPNRRGVSERVVEEPHGLF